MTTKDTLIPKEVNNVSQEEELGKPLSKKQRTSSGQDVNEITAESASQWMSQVNDSSKTVETVPVRNAMVDFPMLCSSRIIRGHFRLGSMFSLGGHLIMSLVSVIELYLDLSFHSVLLKRGNVTSILFCPTLYLSVGQMAFTSSVPKS